MAAKSAPLLVYRIGDKRFPLLDGRGAMLNGGRWNSPGHPVIYGGLSQSGAMLEVLAQANIGRLPIYSEMIIIEIPADLSIETLNLDKVSGWDHQNLISSRKYGDDWIRSQRTVALVIPSVIAPHDRNIMINQFHPDFLKIKSSGPISLKWDQRLFATTKR